MHGDAAFPGEGINSEAFNLSKLNGYDSKGTIHIVTNNQLGFTTNPKDSFHCFIRQTLSEDLIFL